MCLDYSSNELLYKKNKVYNSKKISIPSIISRGIALVIAFVEMVIMVKDEKPTNRRRVENKLDWKFV